MSEHHPIVPEQAHLPEQRHAAVDKAAPEHNEATIEAKRQETLEASRQQIEKEAATTESVKVGEAVPESVPQLAATKDLQEMAYRRALVRNRKQLSRPSRVLSKVIHQPVVDFLSRASENTIARPSGLLAGGVVALIGSSLLLYTAKHYGFRYNFLAFAILFLVGFIVGLTLELVVRLIKHKH